MTLPEYVSSHVVRGECKCGQCLDVGSKPDPVGHTIDLVFFVISATSSPTLDEFMELTRAHKGEFSDANPFDGKEHSYLELGAWIGDQGLAMMYMGLGVILGAFTLLSPAMFTNDKSLMMEMAGRGYLSIQAKRVEVTA